MSSKELMVVETGWKWNIYPNTSMIPKGNFSQSFRVVSNPNSLREEGG